MSKFAPQQPKVAAPTTTTTDHAPAEEAPGHSGDQEHAARVGHRFADIPVRTPSRSGAELIAAAGGGGQVPFRGEMEKSFGQSFSSVRAHLGKGDAMGALGAHAATQRENVFFASRTPSKELVAHELTHVVQNRNAGVTGGVQAKTASGRSDGAAEREADAVARDAAAGRQVSVSAAPGGGLQLKPYKVGDWVMKLIGKTLKPVRITKVTASNVPNDPVLYEYEERLSFGTTRSTCLGSSIQGPAEHLANKPQTLVNKPQSSVEESKSSDEESKSSDEQPKPSVKKKVYKPARKWDPVKTTDKWGQAYTHKEAQDEAIAERDEFGVDFGKKLERNLHISASINNLASLGRFEDAAKSGMKWASDGNKKLPEKNFRSAMAKRKDEDAPRSIAQFGSAAMQKSPPSSLGLAEKLVNESGKDWNKVKEKYIKKGDDTTMRLMLAYRRHEFERIFGLVINEMAADKTCRKRGFKRNMLKLNLPGSNDLTSDMDATLDHPPGKAWVGVEAVKRFNANFRAKWEKESGTVFDVNVYTPGFMPFDTNATPSGIVDRMQGKPILKNGEQELHPEDVIKGGVAKHDIARDLGDVKKAQQAKAKATDDAMADRVRPLDNETRKQVGAVHDVMALVKIRKFMDKDQWARYSKMLLDHMGAENKHLGTAKQRLEKADQTHEELQKELEEKKLELRVEKEKQLKKQAKKGVKPPQVLPQPNLEIKDDEDHGNEHGDPDEELEANNRLYEKYLTNVSAQLNEKDGSKKKDVNYVEWANAQTRANYFANEAYHTSAPAERVVMGQQMKLGVNLTPDETAQAINEQFGFVMEQRRHNKNDPGRFLWKSAKYVDRVAFMMNDLKPDKNNKDNKNNENKRLQNLPVDEKQLELVNKAAKDLLGFKKENISDTEKSKKSVAAQSMANLLNFNSQSMKPLPQHGAVQPPFLKKEPSVEEKAAQAMTEETMKISALTTAHLWANPEE